VAARAEVDPVIVSRDDHGRGTTDLYEVTKDMLDLVTVLDDRRSLQFGECETALHPGNHTLGRRAGRPQ